MDRMEKLIILGGGESGAGAAVLGKVKGFDVFLSDAGPIKPEYRDLLARQAWISKKADIPRNGFFRPTSW